MEEEGAAKERGSGGVKVIGYITFTYSANVLCSGTKFLTLNLSLSTNFFYSSM